MCFLALTLSLPVLTPVIANCKNVTLDNECHTFVFKGSAFSVVDVCNNVKVGSPHYNGKPRITFQSQMTSLYIV